MKKMLVGMAMTLVVAACGDGDSTGSTGSGAGGTGGAGTGTGASGTGGDGTGASGGDLGSGGAGAQGGGTGGGGGSTNSVDACTDCANPLLEPTSGACAPAVQACLADASCDAWAECTEACFDEDAAFTAACFDQCEAANPDGQALYEAIYSCLCMTCSSECAPMCGG